MQTVEEFEFGSIDGRGIFARFWPAAADAVGVVGIVHGLGEHSGRYIHVAEDLVRRGFAVLALDHRGHGRTDGKRGHVDRYERMLDDIERLMEQATKRIEGGQQFLLGHSMGGNLVLSYLLRRQPVLRGAVVLSPMILPARPLPTWKISFARAVNCVWPSFRFRPRIDPRQLSHADDAVRHYTTDPLVHRCISVRLGVEMFAAGRWLLENADRLTVPTLLMHGDADSITSADASRDFAERAGPQCTLKIWPGLYHELHWETNREQVIDAIGSWLVERM